MKNNEICAKLEGLRKSEAEGLFIGRKLRSEENGGGFAPTWRGQWPWKPLTWSLPMGLAGTTPNLKFAWGQHPHSDIRRQFPRRLGHVESISWNSENNGEFYPHFFLPALIK